MLPSQHTENDFLIKRQEASPLGIGLFGGTFDPVHKGHLQLAQDLLTNCPMLSEIRFIPCYQPVHRPTPIATPEQRLRMLALALAAYPSLRVEDWEIQQKLPSYTIDTVSTMQQRYPKHRLYLIVGSDAFAHFCQWRSWEALQQQVHIILVSRSNSPPITDPTLKALLSTHLVPNIHALTQAPSGLIAYAPISTLPISSTEIRQHLSTQLSDPRDLTPEVLDYIRSYRLYNARVSSSLD